MKKILVESSGSNLILFLKFRKFSDALISSGNLFQIKEPLKPNDFFIKFVFGFGTVKLYWDRRVL